MCQTIDISIKIGDEIIASNGTAIVTDYIFWENGGLKGFEVERKKKRAYVRRSKKSK